MQAGIGVYWGHPDHPWNLSQPIIGRRHTNQVAEIQVRSIEIP